MRIRTFGLDFDTIAYAKRIKDGSGTSLIPEKLKEINKFVVGIKRLGIWDKMVCWPMRSIHNAGTGSTVYSLGGLGVYNGTLTNSSTWGYYDITRSAGGFSIYSNTISSKIRAMNGYSLGAVCSDYDNGGYTINIGILKGGGTNQTGDNYGWLSSFYNIFAQGQTYLTGGTTSRGFGSTTYSGYGRSFFVMSRTGLTSPSTDTGFVIKDETVNATSTGTGNLPSTNPYSEDFGIFNTTGINKRISFAFVSSPIDSFSAKSIRTLYKKSIGQNLGLA